MMIVVKLAGGLGNQMFQYAFGRSHALREKAELRLDCSWYSHKQLGSFRSYALSVFPAISSFGIYKKGERRIVTKYDNIERLFFLITKKKMLRYIKEPHFHYWDEIEKLGVDCYFDGYWQSYKYSSNFFNVLKLDFIFSPILEINNCFYERTILNLEAPVAVHVRRGDYITCPEAKQVLGVLDKDYYLAAFSIIESKIANPTYVFFSDDPGWIKKTFLLPRMVVVSGNSEDKAYRDMQLMTLCRHHIIANSSFSWWGAALSDYPGIVIAPSRWSQDRSLNTKDLIPPAWYTI